MPHFSRCERPQHKITMAGLGSPPSFAAQCTNGRNAENQPFAAACRNSHNADLDKADIFRACANGRYRGQAKNDGYFR